MKNNSSVTAKKVKGKKIKWVIIDGDMKNVPFYP